MGAIQFSCTHSGVGRGAGGQGSMKPDGIVRGLIKPRQFIEGRLVASFPITVFWQVELLVLVIFDASAVLIAPLRSR
jgi:hypothetical protein